MTTELHILKFNYRCNGLYSILVYTVYGVVVQLLVDR